MSTSTEISQVTTALAEFDKVGAGLAELEKLYKGVVYPVREKQGMKAAIEARRAIREPRIAIEKTRKAAKAPILELGKKLDTEALRITIALEAIENPIDEQIKNEEQRAHNEAVAKATAERERVERLEARLDTIRLMPYDSTGLGVKSVQSTLDEARALVIGDDWEEFKDKAVSAKVATVAALEGVLAKALAAEAEAKRIIAERAELEQLRAEQANRDAEARKAQEAENLRIANEQMAERNRLAAHKVELDRIEQERAKAAKAEQDRLSADRLALEREIAEQQARIAEDQQRFASHFARETKPELEARLALAVTASQAAAAGLGFKIPFLGSKLSTRMASGAIGNLALNRTSTAIDQQILQQTGNDEAAAQFDPFDKTGIATDIISGLAFGAIHHLSTPEPAPASQERFENAGPELHATLGGSIIVQAFNTWFETEAGTAERYRTLMLCAWVAACAFCEDRL